MSLAAISTVGLLAAVYLMLLPEVVWADGLVAIGIALLILRISPRARHPREARARFHPGAIAAAASLVVDTLVDVALGTWRIARMSVGWGDLPVPGLVELPLGERSLRGAAIHGLLLTLSPGTLLVDIDEERGVMIFHVAGVERSRFEHTAERMYRKQREFLP